MNSQESIIQFLNDEMYHDIMNDETLLDEFLFGLGQNGNENNTVALDDVNELFKSNSMTAPVNHAHGEAVAQSEDYFYLDFEEEVEMESNHNNNATMTLPLVENSDGSGKEGPSNKKKYKCQCAESKDIAIVINIHSKIVGCLGCGKTRLVIENHQRFFQYLADIGKKKKGLIELEISLKFRKSGNYFQPIVESGNLHLLLTTSVFQSLFTLCNIKSPGMKETFADKIERNEEILPFTFEELKEMRIIGSSSNSTKLSKKRDNLNEFKIVENKNKARRM